MCNEKDILSYWENFDWKLMACLHEQNEKKVLFVGVRETHKIYWNNSICVYRYCSITQLICFLDSTEIKAFNAWLNVEWLFFCVVESIMWLLLSPLQEKYMTSMYMSVTKDLMAKYRKNYLWALKLFQKSLGLLRIFVVQEEDFAME